MHADLSVMIQTITKNKFITGQKEREESAQNRTVTTIQPLPTALRMQAIRSKQLRNIYICYIHILSGVGMAPTITKQT